MYEDTEYRFWPARNKIASCSWHCPRIPRRWSPRACACAGVLCFSQIARAMGLEVPEEPDPSHETA